MAFLITSKFASKDEEAVCDKFFSACKERKEKETFFCFPRKQNSARNWSPAPGLPDFSWYKVPKREENIPK
jgi:hypothetical protein